VKNQSAQNGGGHNEHGVLETTAQAIGSTLGSIAVTTGLAKPPTAVEHREPQAASKPGQHPGAKHARRSKKKK
jgi:hypothetical protein